MIATSFYSVLAWFISAALLYFTECDNPETGAQFQVGTNRIVTASHTHPLPHRPPSDGLRRSPPPPPPPAQPPDLLCLQSIPSALFPTLLMLTGEFPIADFTAPGRFIAGFIAVVAVAIFAVPTAVLGSGFVKAVQRARQMEFTVDA